MRWSLWIVLATCVGCGSTNVTNVYEVAPVESGTPDAADDAGDAAADAPGIDAAPDDAQADDAGSESSAQAHDAAADGPADAPSPMDAGDPCATCSTTPPQGPALNCAPAWGPYSYAMYCPADCASPPTPVGYTAVSYGDYDSGTGYWCIYTK